MLLDLTSLLLAASLASGASIPRQDADTLVARQDPGLQDIPTTAKADNTFSNGGPQVANWKSSDETPPSVYGNRTIDLPFGRLYHGNLKFFSKGQLNSANGDTDQWLPQATDSAEQSACGIPDNAFSISKVAIHPYFLKYVDLSRYCMQDVCISFWREDGMSDMMLKVTDICSTDPNDPTHCATPADIKVDRTKAKIMEQIGSVPEGDEYSGKVWWFFMKCWADGLVQDAYADNWFAQPPLPNNLGWAQATQHQQWANNQESYPNHDPPLPLYFNGAYDTVRDNTSSPPIEDFDPNETYSWTPIAGGKGWGNPSGRASGASSSNEEAASGSSVSSAAPAVASDTQASGQSGGQSSGHASGQGGGVTLVRPSSPAASSARSGTNSQESGQGSGLNLVTPNSNTAAEKSPVNQEESCDDE